MENKLQSGKVWKVVFALAFPAMLGQLINVLYGIIDRVYIGNLEGVGELALSGVGICNPIVTLISSFACLIGLGGAPLMAICMGEKNAKSANKILANAFIALMVLSILLMIVVFAFKEPLLLLFGATQNSLVYANEYMTYYAAGIIFAVGSLGLNQFISAQGFSKIAMITLIVGAVTNIVLDPILIFNLNMGVKGAAIATVIAQGLSFLFTLLFLLGKKTLVRLTFKGYDFKVIKKICILGLSPFLIAATDSVILIILNSSLKSYGGVEADKYIAVCTIVQSYFSLITMPLLGISSGTQAILSYNYGARDTLRIKSSIKVIASIALGFTSTCLIVSLFAATPFFKVFTKNEEYIFLADKFIKWYLIGIIPLAFQYCFVDALTALSQPKLAVVLSITRKTMIAAFTIILPMIYGAQMAFLAQGISDIISSTITFIVFMMLINKILIQRESSNQSFFATE